MTVVGPGGSGKTRLAVETARRLAGRFEDDVGLVELAQIDDPGLVALMAATALGVAEHRSLPMVEAVGAVVGPAVMSWWCWITVSMCSTPPPSSARGCWAAGTIFGCWPPAGKPSGCLARARFVIPPLPVPTVEESGGAVEEFDAVALFVERAIQADADFVLSACRRRWGRNRAPAGWYAVGDRARRRPARRGCAWAMWPLGWMIVS